MSASQTNDSRSEAEYCSDLKAQTKAAYESTKSVICPYFNAEVGFNADGFHHMQYMTSGAERSKKAQIRRYKSFRFAPYILKRAGTVQQHRRYYGPVGRPKGDGYRETKIIEDWCFVSLVKAGVGTDICIKVVVRRIGDGSLHFLSVMPSKAPDYLSDADSDA